jgi:hypothetical protein
LGIPHTKKGGTELDVFRGWGFGAMRVGTGPCGCLRFTASTRLGFMPMCGKGFGPMWDEGLFPCGLRLCAHVGFGFVPMWPRVSAHVISGFALLAGGLLREGVLPHGNGAEGPAAENLPEA